MTNLFYINNSEEFTKVFMVSFVLKIFSLNRNILPTWNTLNQGDTPLYRAKFIFLSFDMALCIFLASVSDPLN